MKKILSCIFTLTIAVLLFIPQNDVIAADSKSIALTAGRFWYTHGGVGTNEYKACDGDGSTSWYTDYVGSNTISLSFTFNDGKHKVDSIGCTLYNNSWGSLTDFRIEAGNGSFDSPTVIYSNTSSAGVSGLITVNLKDGALFVDDSGETRVPIEDNEFDMIRICRNTGGGSMLISEISAYGSKAPTHKILNLAHNGLVSLASNDYDYSWDGKVKETAIDDDMSSCWYNKYAGDRYVGLVVDFGQGLYNVEKISFSVQARDSSDGASDFHIELSDNSSFENAVTVYNADSKTKVFTQEINLNSMEEVSQRTYRYLRLVRNTKGGSIKIYDISAFGTKVTDSDTVRNLASSSDITLSGEESGANVENAFDGNLSTYLTVSYGESIMIDLKGLYSVSGIKLMLAGSSCDFVAEASTNSEFSDSLVIFDSSKAAVTSDEWIFGENADDGKYRYIRFNALGEDGISFREILIWSSDFELVDIKDAVDFYVDVEEGRNIRVLQLTDPQIIESEQQRSASRLGEPLYSNWSKTKKEDYYKKYIRYTINKYRPDFIFITGDVVYGEFDDNGESLLDFIEFMDSFRIPWAPVFGNHDNESMMGVDWQCEQFEESRYCLFKQRALTGNGNYTVGLRQGGVLKRVFFMLDSNGCGGMSSQSLANGHGKTSVGFGNDQINWYMTYANSITAQSPETKLSFAFHIQPYIFKTALAKYGFDTSLKINLDEVGADGDFGYVGRVMKTPWDSDNKVWNGIKALGADSIFVGHEHCNNASVMYDGVRLQYGLKSSLYDRTNYIRPDGLMEVGSYIPTSGIPQVGGTAIDISANDGTIADAYRIVYNSSEESDKYKYILAGDGHAYFYPSLLKDGVLIAETEKDGKTFSADMCSLEADAVSDVVYDDGCDCINVYFWNISDMKPYDLCEKINIK